MPRALVVDDDPAIRRLVQKLLEREKFDVEGAKDGQEAVDILQTADFDVIFLDLMMPRMSGHEVIQWMRTEKPAILGRVIVVTAQRESELRESTSDGIRSVIHKPFDISEVVRIARECAG
jgi:CheY-like chemotaxis protein